MDHHKTVESYNPYCYTGREFDAQDLYYYRARYYDPSVGRFISSDPIEFLAGDTNFYRYVGGDPVNFVDPSGLCPPCLAGLYVLGELAVDALIGTSIEAVAVGTVGRAVLRKGGQVVLKKVLKKTAAKSKEVAKSSSKAGTKHKGKKKKKKCKDPTGKKTEKKMDNYYKMRGYKKISTEKYHGIDGVYKHRITGKYVVGEAKFNTSRLGKTKDGKQMSKDWVDSRLAKQVSKKDITAMKDGYAKEVFHVDKNCKKSKKKVIDIGPKNVKLGPKIPILI